MKNSKINGSLVFMINIVLVLFLLSDNFKDIVNISLGIISSVIAVIFNCILIKDNKNRTNIVFLILNIIIVLLMSGYLIYVI